MHGWPYDPRCYDEVVPPLAGAGCRIIVPYLRGFGATRFLSAATPRSGQQAALGNDLRELMDALAVERAVLAGYDWGGRAACIVAALWPDRVRALVTVNSYNLQNIPASGKPGSPAQEHRLWYQYYFHTERGRAGLEANRRALCRAALVVMVAGLAFRRRDVRAQRRLIRQSGFRRGHDPLVSPSLRLCAGRSGARRRSSTPCRAAQRSRCRPSRCRARADGVHPPRELGEARRPFYRALSRAA